MDVLFAIALPQEWKIAIVLGLLALAVVFFARETLPVDVLTLVLLLVLVGTGTVSVATAFSGFSSEIIIMLASIFVLGGALQETGVVEALGARLLRLARGGENRLLFVLVGVASGLSAFMNNTRSPLYSSALPSASPRKSKSAHRRFSCHWPTLLSSAALAP